MKKLKLNIVWKTWNLKFVKLLRNPRKRKKILAILLIFALLIPLAIYFNPGEAEAAWFDDGWAYRKRITIGNSGAADSNKKVKIDTDTADSVDPETVNFNTTVTTFTEGMAKRNGPGPFTTAPIIQGDPNNADSLTDDVTSFSRGTQISGNFYSNIDTTQGSAVLWWTPEYSYNALSGTGDHYIWYVNSNYFLAYEYDNDRYNFTAGGQSLTVSSSIAAGTTYGLVARWDTNNTISGSNYLCFAIDDVDTCGATTQPTASAPDATIYVGSNGTTGGGSGITEYLSFYRRVLYDGSTGINASFSADEVSKIKLSGGADPTLTTGSWDVALALPTNQTAGALATGNGSAWSHPHSSNLLYTSTTNTGGFMMNGTYTSDGWADEGTPSSVSALAASEKIFTGGYKTVSDAANEGIYYDKTVSAGNDWVVRAIAHSDGTSVPKIILYDQTNGAEIGSLTGTTTSTRTAPNVFIFTGEAPAGMTTLRVKLVNTAASGTAYWHQVEVLGNNLTNPSFATGSGDPWIPTGWANEGPAVGQGIQETSIVHSGNSSYKLSVPSGQGGKSIYESGGASNLKFYAGGFWGYEESGSAGGWNASNRAWIQQHTATTKFDISLSGASWSLYKGVARFDLSVPNSFYDHMIVGASYNAAAVAYYDDVFIFQLDDVSPTVTPATKANSTETSGLRVDGRDSATQTVSNLTTTSGTIKFDYTPRHSAADALKFLESTDVYITELYGDADDYIRLYWNAANTITLAYSMGGTTGSSTWDATGAIAAGTTYSVQIAYTGGGNMTLAVDGSTKITLATIPASFGTAPATAYWGSRQAGDRQADATFDATSVATGKKMQADCGDIRFTDANGKILKYYVDTTNGDCNTESTDIYVLMENIVAGNNVVYMYYGNPSAVNGGEGAQFSQATFSPTSGPTTASEVKGPAPVGYWKFDEGYGTTPSDSTLNNNDAAMTGGTWQTKDMCISGNCMFFDGSDDVATVTNANPLDFDVGLSGGVTFAGWVRVNSDGEASVGEIFNKGTNTYMRITNEGSDGLADLEAKLDLATTDATATVTNGITLNRWHHVAFGYTDDGDDEITVYIDGVSRATSTNGGGSPASSDTNNLLIGGTSTANFHGFIDEFKVYDFERTESEIKTDFAKKGAQGSSAVLGARDDASFLNDGLVGYWDMDETAANTCTGAINDSCDSSGNGRDGAWQADATNGSGKFGNGTTFDGSGDYTDLSSTISFGTTNPFTISFWGKSNGAGSGGNDGVIGGTWPANWVVWEGYYSGLKTSGSGQTDCLGSGLGTGTWKYLTITRDSSNVIKYYIDASLNKTCTGGTNTVNVKHFGRAQSSEYWNGTLDEVRIYNRALSPSEVEGLYNFAPGPVGHWKLDENTGQTAYDASSNGDNGTLGSTGDADTNDPSWTVGKFGSALNFDGSNDYTAISGLSSQSTSTLEFWFNPSLIEANGGTIRQLVTIGTCVFQLNQWGVSPRNYLHQQGACGGNDYWDTGFSANQWQHIAIVQSGGGLTVYKNAVAVSLQFGNNNIYSSLNYGTFQFGESSTDLIGKIDDVRLYNYARTQKQIIEDMNAGHPAPGSPVGSSIAHWKMDDMQGTTAQDSTDNNNDLTLSAASWTASGKINGAWNGTGARWLTKTDDSDFDVSATDSYTVSLWIKSDAAANPGATEYLFNKAGATTAGYAVYANTSGQICFGIDDDTSWGPDISSCSPTSLYDAAWHHILAVRDVTADKTLIYIDGILRDSDTDTTTATLANSLALYVGDRDGTDNGDEFNGDIDEVKVFRFALTADEAKVEANAGSSAAFGGVLGSSEASDLTGGAGNPPVAHWSFNENKDNTCSGGVNDVCDISGNGNDGAKTNMEAADWVPVTDAPAHANGLGGSTLEFDGSDDYVDNNSVNFGLHGGTQVSFSAWVKPRLTASGAVFSKHFNYVPDQTYKTFSLDINSNGSVSCRVEGPNPLGYPNWVTNAGTVDANNWYHVGCSWNRQTGGASDMTVYVNGIPQSTTFTASNYGASFYLQENTTNMTIGARFYTSYSGFFPGQIDDIRIYDYALSQAQVSYLYNRGGPVGWWKFDECQGTTAYDSSGKGNNGTITPGAGTNTSAGTCGSGNGNEMWDNGTTGKLNYSLDFDNADDYVDIGTGPTSVNSVSFWVNPTTTTEYFVNLTGTTDYIWSNAGTVTATGFSSPTIYVNGQVSSALTAGTWQHVTVVTATAENASNLDIGRTADANYMDGQIDDVRIYNYALSQAQIRKIMNESAQRFGPVTGSP